MANLLHRLLRPRRHYEDTSAGAPLREPLGRDEPDVEQEEPSASRSAATPKPATRGPRKSRDEVSSIGPGEP
jgi:hypothetical protein